MRGVLLRVVPVVTAFYVLIAATILLISRDGVRRLYLSGSGEAVTYSGAPFLAGRTVTSTAAGGSYMNAVLSSVPPEFDWLAYLRWNPDLRAGGVDTREAAESHYLQHGWAENRLHTPGRLTIRYSTCGGVFKQQYCHLAAAVLAILVGADELVWPPALEREAFTRTTSTEGRGAHVWSYVDASALWDVDATHRALSSQFPLTVRKHPPLERIGRLDPGTPFQNYAPDAAVDLHVRLDAQLFIRRMPPSELSQAVMAAVLGAAVTQRVPRPAAVLLDLPCTFFMLDLRGLALAEDVALAMRWAPQPSALASKVVAGLQGPARNVQYNGVHLRVEKDASEWISNTGGEEHWWGEYTAAMSRAKFNEHPLKPLYVASALMRSAAVDADSAAKLAQLSGQLLGRGFASSVVHKELFLSGDELSGLLNEQAVLVDYLVLREAAAVVGVGMSTFSFYLQEDRLMDGRDPRDTVLIFMPSIGTDELFFAAGVAAARTRGRLLDQHRLNETCQRATLEPCFS